MDSKNKMSKPKEKHRYIFPSKVAKAMKKVDTRTQLEASLLSTTLITSSMFMYVIYLSIFGQGWMRWMWVFNLSCGVVLLGSSMVTTFQQWVGHLEMMSMDPDKEKAEVKKSGNIFKRIKMAIVAAKFKKKQAKRTEETNPDSNDEVTNYENSKKILLYQGKIEFKCTPDTISTLHKPIIPKVKGSHNPKLKKRINKVKKEMEDINKLYEEQQKFLEEH